ncbi:hypothetical protein CEXT_237481 [Caerostris extrusa]|uniref:Uncharacterized protein n=1 Tax=Caerostris extrusa TaxID=172846 RepID=A0AAV4VH83_CAEEX|nr:hypothetical protein CEXT_237481 [Caerostris extrusa]
MSEKKECIWGDTGIICLGILLPGMDHRFRMLAINDAFHVADDNRLIGLFARLESSEVKRGNEIWFEHLVCRPNKLPPPNTKHSVVFFCGACFTGVQGNDTFCFFFFSRQIVTFDVFFLRIRYSLFFFLEFFCVPFQIIW